MADPVLFKIFLSSPGDVPQERDDAQTVIAEINASHEFSNRFRLEVYRWDNKDRSVPMVATQTPQTSVNTYVILPSQCDLVVVIFWSRMGSPLVMDAREYLSGTHYEYSEALQGYEQVGKPTVWLYRCAEEPFVSQRDPKRDERNQQFDRVEQFFKQFQDSEGRYTGGVNAYATHDDFKALFKGQLLTYLRHLRDNPRGELPPPPVSATFAGVPYRGLSALDEGDTPIFFGRAAETLEVLSRVEKQRLVFVLGASGSGKSSLVAAGVLPQLRERGWRVVRCVPGDDPFFSLALGLLPPPADMGAKMGTYLKEARALATQLSVAPDALVNRLEKVGAGKRTLLFIDQFEEVFTLAEKNPDLPAGSVAAFLQAIRQPSAAVTTLVTMRADFYGVALPYFEELEQHAYGLRPPSPFALYEMITRPAALAGLTLDDGLAAQIVEEVGSESGALALISYVLESLYLRAQARGDGKLTHHDYAVELKGVRGAINTLADRAYADLPFAEAAREQALQAVFRELIALTEEDGQWIPTRRRAPLASFTKGSDAAQLIDTFVEARLLVKDGVGTTPASSAAKPDNAGVVPTRAGHVEVAHEAILRHWEALADWIGAIKGDLALFRQYERDAKTWAERGEDTPRPPHEALIYFERALASLGYQRADLPEPLKTYTEPEATRLLQELEILKTNHERRRDIGDRLAVIGDPRPGVGVKDGLPDLLWLPVAPGGEITIKYGASREREQKFTVPPFYIAQYLITYAQFQAFLDAPDGFTKDRWWLGMSDQYKKQAMQPQRTKIANAPRDTVSWYQSVAFARWLDAKYRKLGLFAQFPVGKPNGMPVSDGRAILYPYDEKVLNPYDWQIRLPTEWEWQWMAQGGAQARNHPWGKWQEGFANTSDAGLSRTTAIGMYPQSRAECGALDVVGNVFEWCLNDYYLHGT